MNIATMHRNFHPLDSGQGSHCKDHAMQGWAKGCDTGGSIRPITHKQQHRERGRMGYERGRLSV